MAFMMNILLAALLQADPYPLGPDSQRQEGVPRGQVLKQEPWKSQIFPNTARDWWIYVPANHDPSKRAPIMIFQDGWSYANEKGQFRSTIAFDNLIHKKEIPALIGVFINPGGKPDAKPGDRAYNRSFEYDSLSDLYARFLLEEILPEVNKKYPLSKEGKDRAICGISSGGICAWTAAWERPGEFSKVLSHVGSFTNIRGGHVYASLIRKSPPRPIRIFLQDGAKDLDNEHGNWPLANQEMAASLKFKKYDHRFEFGTEGHNGKHGGAILPESLRWLWRADTP